MYDDVRYKSCDTEKLIHVYQNKKNIRLIDAKRLSKHQEPGMFWFFSEKKKTDQDQTINRRNGNWWTFQRSCAQSFWKMLWFWQHVMSQFFPQGFRMNTADYKEMLGRLLGLG